MAATVGESSNTIVGIVGAEDVSATLPLPTEPLAPSATALAIRYAFALAQDLAALDGYSLPADSVRGGRWHCLRCGWRWDSAPGTAIDAPAMRTDGKPRACARCRTTGWDSPTDARAPESWRRANVRAKAAWLGKRAEGMQRIAATVARELELADGPAALMEMLRPEAAAYLCATEAARVMAAKAANALAEAADADARAAEDDPRRKKKRRRKNATGTAALRRATERRDAVKWDGMRFGPATASIPMPAPAVAVQNPVETVENVPSRSQDGPFWDDNSIPSGQATTSQLREPGQAFKEMIFAEAVPTIQSERSPILRGPVLAPAPPSLDDLRERELPPLVTQPLDETR